MRPVILLRIANLNLLVFLLGHTLGTISSSSRGPEEAALMAALRGYQFDVMGVTRTHGDFYFGLGLSLSAALVGFIWLTHSATRLAATQPAAARPFVYALATACGLLACLSWTYFFPAPAVMTTLATACFAWAAAQLR